MADKQWNDPPEMQIDTHKTYKLMIETNRGSMELELYPEHAPKTVNNFVFLAKEGYYDGVVFHRVISNFMIQGGDPTGTGRGGPGYKFEDEVAGNPLKHERCVISMANAGPNTNGSQFFITYKPTPWLDDRHSVFGRVVEGIDVLNSISLRDPGTATTPGDLIKTIRIEER
jgi:peptidyl-prolyl cis-trans isomerase B (cyclophilin B)